MSQPVATPRSLPIRLLILEDRPEDAELMIYELRRSWFDPAWERLQTEADFLAALKIPPDVILADYRMPLLDAPRALELLRHMELDIPFIVVSGAIGEDAAVAIMRQGATDYLLKDRLKRLGPAVRRALEEQQLREDKRKAESALRASEARFYSFMNNSPASAFIKSAGGRIIYINNTCEQLWNASLAECQGKLDSELWPPDEAARIRALELSILEKGRPIRSIEELPNRDGQVRHLLSFRFPFEDAAAARLIGGVSVDITERIQAERALARALAAKEVLFKEVHHRVKNNLQIICSLLNLQSDLLPDPALKQILLETQRRVEAMAMIHERLYSHDDLDSLDLREYVETLARQLFSACGLDSNLVRLRLELEPVSLELGQAIPCGLILNEFLTNSLKYAFRDGRSGEILVSLSTDTGDRITLRVADDGPGLPAGFDWSKTSSLGLRIAAILARQLKGTLETEPGPGARLSVSFQKAVSQSPVRPPARAASRSGGK